MFMHEVGTQWLLPFPGSPGIPTAAIRRWSSSGMLGIVREHWACARPARAARRHAAAVTGRFDTVRLLVLGTRARPAVGRGDRARSHAKNRVEVANPRGGPIPGPPAHESPAATGETGPPRRAGPPLSINHGQRGGFDMSVTRRIVMFNWVSLDGFFSD